MSKIGEFLGDCEHDEVITALEAKLAAVTEERDRLAREVELNRIVIGERIDVCSPEHWDEDEKIEAERDALKARAEAAEAELATVIADCQTLNKVLTESDEEETRLEADNARLRELISKLERGCDCEYDYRCYKCQAVLNARAALSGGKEDGDG